MKRLKKPKFTMKHNPSSAEHRCNVQEGVFYIYMVTIHDYEIMLGCAYFFKIPFG